MKDCIDLALSFIRELGGERVAGTSHEERARSIFKKYFREIGVEYREDPFELYISDGLEGYLEIDNKKIDIRPFGLSVPYDIEGELVYFDHPEEALALNVYLQNKICLFALRPSYEDILKIKKRGCKGFLLPAPPYRDLLSLHLQQKAIKDNAIIPAASIKYEDAVFLLDHTGKKAKLKGFGNTFKTRAFNLEVMLKGKSVTSEEVLITGHYDTVPFSPGFSDNGAGVATMIALLKHFYGRPLKRNLRFVFFSGEEWGLCGSFTYAEKRKDDLKNIVCGVNLDVGGAPVGHMMARITGGEKIKNVVEGYWKESGIHVEVKKGIYSSDSVPFAKEGVPFVNLARVGGLASFNIHTKNDRGFYLNRKGFEKYFEAARILIDRLANASLLPFERCIDEEVKKEINEYLKERI